MHRCALLAGKWIYNGQFTRNWAKQNVPAEAWVQGRAVGTWEWLTGWPPDAAYDKYAQLMGSIAPGVLTLRLADAQGQPLAG